ncbi:MAG: CDP-alcohol phosphatidyltransferase family protein [Candidatus Levyibacteriota bacterium]
MRVVKSTYYSNWGDLFGYKIAQYILPFAAKAPFLTPNIISILSFLLFFSGSILLLLPYPQKALGGILILAGYVGDDLDGQFARYTKKTSVIGDYLDKVLDIIKIFIITFFAGLSIFLITSNIAYLFFGFIAAFFFMLRYYIKLETMFSALSRDKNYLEKSAKKRTELEKKMDVLYAKEPSSVQEFISIFWVKMRTIFLVDEAEFAIFIAVGSFVNRVGLALLIIAVAQVIIAFWRFYERGKQLKENSPKLFLPMRK